MGLAVSGKWRPACVLAGVFAVATLVASPFDLEIAAAVYAPGSAFGAFIAHHAPKLLYPLYAWCVWAYWRSGRGRGPAWLKVAATALIAQALGHAYALTTALKWLWGRPRYVVVLSGRADYASIYSLNPGAGVSFPSGHVATALVTLSLAYVLIEAGRRPAGYALGLATLAWGAVVAFGRMQMGAHFLSDTLASFALACLLAPLSARLGFLLARTEKPRGEEGDQHDEGRT